MKLWSAFYDYILPLVPGATYPLVDLQLRNSTIEFLDETGVVDYVAVPILTKSGVATYSVNAPGADYTAARVKYAKYEDTQLAPVITDVLDTHVTNWAEIEGSPSHYYMADPTTIRLYPIPDADNKSVSLVLTLRPTRDAQGVEDFIFDRYVETITHGAVARLAAMPNKPWTNFDLALRAGSLYFKDKKDAMIEVNKNFTRGNLRVQFKRVM